MDIIPVIDVRHGIAVRAVAGDRGNYQPLPSTPLAIALAYRNLYPFPALYVADLDGIEGRGANAELAASLHGALPTVDVWIDAGQSQMPAKSIVTTVIGSEALDESDIAAPLAPAAVLSLDFLGDRFLGPPALLHAPELWPSRVIVMTLARVGTDAGPDLDRIAQIARLAPHVCVYAAGGIRNVGDLRAARAAGASGALVASALHAQKIKADDLIEIIGL